VPKNEAGGPGLRFRKTEWFSLSILKQLHNYLLNISLSIDKRAAHGFFRLNEIVGSKNATSYEYLSFALTLH
jgi:hypothetical protein